MSTPNRRHQPIESVSVGLGCGSLGAFPTFVLDHHLISGAQAIGVEDFDTAPSYNRGGSERVLGLFLKHRGRARVTTKIGVGYLGQSIVNFAGEELGVFGRTIPNINNRREQLSDLFPPESLRHYLAGSLHRLRTKTVFRLLLHSVPDGLDLSPWADALLTLKKEGFATEIGLSVDEDVSLSDVDMGWADALEIPFSLTNSVVNSNLPRTASIIVNRIYSGEFLTIREAIPRLAIGNRALTLLSGTRHLARLRDAKRAVVERTRLGP